MEVCARLTVRVRAGVPVASPNQISIILFTYARRGGQWGLPRRLGLCWDCVVPAALPPYGTRQPYDNGFPPKAWTLRDGPVFEWGMVQVTNTGSAISHDGKRQEPQNRKHKL